MTYSTKEHPFAPFIRILGKGKTGTRSLNQQESQQAFSMILRGEAEPLQIGAFLMLLRVKEESAEELAGFVLACRDNIVAPPRGLKADLDWSSYAGKRHQHPWFILALLLLNEAGYRVFIHGFQGQTDNRLYTEAAFRQLHLPIASDWTTVSQQLDRQRISYLPLEKFCRPLNELMQLRSMLGLRSPVNTLSRLINPLCAAASVQSVFHPAYTRLHQEAEHLLGQPSALVFKGDSGEAEVKPQADTRISLLKNKRSQDIVLPRTLSYRVQSVKAPSVDNIRDLWRGETEDQYGLDATLGTTATALLALEPDIEINQALEQAQRLWLARDTLRLA